MKLELPARSFRAYLFDCDGTIVDSMPLHYIAWKKALAEWNCVFEEPLFYAWGGRPVTEIIAALNHRDGLNMPVDAVARRKEDFYLELLPQIKATSRWPLFPEAAAIRSLAHSPRFISLTNSMYSFVRKTTFAASRRPTVSWWLPNVLACRLKTASSLKTLTWASKPRRPRVWLPCACLHLWSAPDTPDRVTGLTRRAVYNGGTGNVLPA
jgi:hypothetical protein